MKTKNIVIIAVVSVIVIIAAIITAIVVVNNNKRPNVVVQQPSDNVTVAQSEPTVNTEITEETVNDEVEVEDSSEETVVEVEEQVEEQDYTDFDSWVDSIVNDDSIKALPGVLIWNADTNKHEMVDYRYGYSGLEAGDKVYARTEDIGIIICNGEGIYNADDELYNDIDGALYIELPNIKLGEKNTIEVKFYGKDDVRYVWEVE